MDLIPDNSRSVDTQRNDATPGDPRLDGHRVGDQRFDEHRFDGRRFDDCCRGGHGADFHGQRAHADDDADRRFARTMQRLGFSPSLVTPRLVSPPSPRPRRLPGDPAAGDWRPL